MRLRVFRRAMRPWPYWDWSPDDHDRSEPVSRRVDEQAGDRRSYLLSAPHGRLDRIGVILVPIAEKTKIDDRQVPCECSTGDAVVEDGQSSHDQAPSGLRDARIVDRADRR